MHLGMMYTFGIVDGGLQFYFQRACNRAVRSNEYYIVCLFLRGLLQLLITPKIQTIETTRR